MHVSLPAPLSPSFRALVGAGAGIVACAALCACTSDSESDVTDEQETTVSLGVDTPDTPPAPGAPPHALPGPPAPMPPPPAPAGAELPIDTLPVGNRNVFNECPYLNTQWVADVNGQRVTGVDIDTRFDPPACVYFSYPEEPQLQVMVRHMHNDTEAIDVVNWAAPIEHTNPADLPGDWMGGRAGAGMIPDRFGSVFAVQHGPTAVVVISNQEQSFKAEQVAVEVMKNLRLAEPAPPQYPQNR